MNATASSQTGCSGLAPAPELCPSGAPAAATSPPAFVNKPYPFSNSYQISLLLNLTHTTFCCGACRRGMDDSGFGTLGGGSACDAKLGTRSPECHGNHDLAGGDGAWGSPSGVRREQSREQVIPCLERRFCSSPVCFLARRLSINFAMDLEERVSGALPIRIEPKEATSIALKRELLAA